MSLDIQDNHDGYHTFRELYNCRHALYLALANSRPDIFFKSEKNNHFEGWFLVWGDLGSDIGQVSFHLPNSWYEDFKLQIKDCQYDGHNTNDVIARLIIWSRLNDSFRAD